VRTLPDVGRGADTSARSARFEYSYHLVLAVLVVLVATIAAGCSGGSAELTKGESMFSISSPAFETGGLIPSEYATTRVPGGANTSIPFEWRNAPAGTQSFALTLIDRAPVARDWIHRIVYDIPAMASALPAGASSSRLPEGAKEAANTFGSIGYGGPQPPPGTGKHPYEATIYALDVPALNLSPGSGRVELERAIKGHVLGTATMTGAMGR
jgi:hypothetical protein